LDEPLLEAVSLPDVPRKRDVRWVFLGSNGLIRAGWGALLFALLYVLFLFCVSWLTRSFLREMRHLPTLALRIALIAEITQFLPTIFATTVMALLERRSPLAYGFHGEKKRVRFFSGLAWGLIALSVLLLVLWKAHLLAWDGALLHGGTAVQYAFGWGLMFLLVAFFEESTLRGYLQFTLTRGIGFWWSALLLSVLFGFSHGSNPGETPVGLFAAAGIAVVFCISLWYTGSLWWAVGFHASWDWGESYLYGTSDSGMVVQGHLLGSHPIGPRLWSGGTTGPEGSLLVIGLIVVMGLMMWGWWGKRTVSPWRDCGWKPVK
jgi:uncharacterized protein